MGFFDPDPYGGTAPWAEAAMLLGGGLMAGGAPGGGGLGALGDTMSQMARMGQRRQQNARLARAEERAGRAEERAQEGLQLQKAAMDFRRNQALQEAQKQWRVQAALGVPPEILGPMPGTGPSQAPIPPEGPVRASQSTGLSYVTPGATSAGLMPTPPGGLMDESYFSTIPPEMQGVAASLIMEDPMQAVRLIESMQKESRPRQFEVEKQAMLDAGMTEEEYNNLVMNRERYRPYVDELGNRRIMDLLNPSGPVAPAEPPEAPPPGLAPSEVGEAPVLDEPERVAGVPTIPEGYEEAFGWSGSYRDLANEVAGFFGAENLPYEQTQRAETAIETLNTRTKLEMAEGIPGRPSNLTREEIGKLGVTPTSIFTGDEKAKIRVEETVGLLDAQIENFRRISEDQTAPVDQRQAATRKYNTLREMRDGWKQVLDSFENPYNQSSMEDLRALDRSELTPKQLEQVKERYKQLRRFGVPDPNEGLGLY